MWGIHRNQSQHHWQGSHLILPRSCPTNRVHQITLRSAKVRQIGMALLTIPVAKLFVFDVFLLERGYRVAAFVTLGVLLLGAGLVYQRYSQLDAMSSHSGGSTNGPVVKLQCRRLGMVQLAKGVFGCRDGGLACYIGNEGLRIWESTLVGEMK